MKKIVFQRENFSRFNGLDAVTFHFPYNIFDANGEVVGTGKCLAVVSASVSLVDPFRLSGDLLSSSPQLLQKVQNFQKVVFACMIDDFENAVKNKWYDPVNGELKRRFDSENTNPTIFTDTAPIDPEGYSFNF